MAPKRNKKIALCFTFVPLQELKLTFTYLFIVTSLLFGQSTTTIWSITRLQPNSAETIPSLQASLIVTLHLFGNFLGALLFIVPCNLIGRRKTILLASILTLFFHLVLTFTTNVYLYIITCCSLGTLSGGAFSCVAVYLSEISEDNNRGKLGCLLVLSYPLGVLQVYILTSLFNAKVFAILCSIPYIFNISGLLTFVPESPQFLAWKGKTEDARESLWILREKSFDSVEREYDKILNGVECSKKLTVLDFFRTKAHRRGLLISIGCVLLQQFSGFSAVTFFSKATFLKVNPSMTDNDMIILIASIEFSCMTLTTTVVEKFGRKPLFIVSCTGSSISLIITGIYFYLQSMNGDMFIIPLVVSILLYYVTYSLGLGIIPFVLMAEFFPCNVKSFAISLITAIIAILTLIMLVVFSYIKNLVNNSVCLWVYGLVTLSGCWFVSRIVPEVKGKSVSKIQKKLENNKL